MRGCDRRELAVLALVALAWGLVAAPLLHTLEHAHGHQHHHGAPRDSRGAHAAGSLEHLSALGLEANEAPAPRLVLSRVVRPEPQRPGAPWLSPPRSEAEPQGP